MSLLVLLAVGLIFVLALVVAVVVKVRSLKVQVPRELCEPRLDADEHRVGRHASGHTGSESRGFAI